jgi:hypothetical protein
MLAGIIVVLTAALSPARAAPRSCLKTQPPPATLDDLRACQEKVRAAALRRVRRQGRTLTARELEAIDARQRAETRRFLDGDDDDAVINEGARSSDASAAPDARAAAIAKAAGMPTLPDQALPTVEAGGETDLAACPASRCLTLIVAPWCPYCRASTSGIVKLRAYLKGRGVPSRLVVTGDEEEKLRDYAGKFGADALYDPGGRVKPRGVPYYCISGKGGEITKEGNFSSGDLDDPARFASEIGLR